MIHVLIEEELYDEAFVRDWTNGPFLVRDDNQQLLTAHDLAPSGSAQSFVIWDTARNALTAYIPDHGYAESNVKPALVGAFPAALPMEHPSYAGRLSLCLPSAPRNTRPSVLSWSPGSPRRRSDAPRECSPASDRPVTSPGPDWKCTATRCRLNRAVCCFYALTGQYDAIGSNVLAATTPIRPVDGPQLLSKEKAAIRLGLNEHPLGPPNDPGHVQAAPVYDAILTGQPYKVRAMVCFGSDPLLGQGDPARGKEALAALEFYVHMDFFANPSAMFADLLLPASMSWETESFKTNFGFPKGASADALRWVQARKVVVPPPPGTRSDLEVIFDLACRLGLGEHFFGGDMDTAWRHMLEPSGITLEDLRAHPLGVKADATTHHRKYAAADPQTGRPRGFATPSRKLELYSTRFASVGYDPLPCHEEPAESPLRSSDHSSDYPLVLTSFRHVQYVSDGHRNVPRLRNEVRDPLIEIHPDTAASLRIG